MKKRILCTFGTRPEVIKMAPVIHALLARDEVELFTCNTGQHREMSAPILEWFGVRPTHDLSLMTTNQGLTHFMAQSLMKLDEVIEECRPDIVVCQGDTTTAAAASLAAFHRKIAVAHVEAGLRTGNRFAPWPEENNRRIIDLVADYYFAPTDAAVQNLLREDIPAASVTMTGNTAIDALQWTLRKTEQAGSIARDSWPATLLPMVDAVSAGNAVRDFVLITAHRRESFGDGMKSIAAALNELARRFPETDWVFPIHLNPNVREVMHSTLAARPNMVLAEPLDYPHFCWMLARAKLVLTDSGGVQEEGSAIGKPILVMREVTERPEAVAAGSARLVGCSADNIVKQVSELLNNPEAVRQMSQPRAVYGDGRSAERIAAVLAESK